jgi:hypothetical protein
MSGAQDVLDQLGRRHGRPGRLTRRDLLAGALGLMASSAIARTATAAGLTDDPFGGLLADPPGGQRFSPRLQGKEVCSFARFRLDREDQTPTGGWPVGGIDPGDLDAPWSDRDGDTTDPNDGDKTGSNDGDDRDDDTHDATVVLRNGTAASMALRLWHDAGRLASNTHPKEKQQPSAPEASTRTLAQQDAVIVRLSAAGKALGQVTLREASVKTLVYAPDQTSVKKLELIFERLDRLPL